jgi:hypothetical protein
MKTDAAGGLRFTVDGENMISIRNSLFARCVPMAFRQGAFSGAPLFEPKSSTFC